MDNVLSLLKNVLDQELFEYAFIYPIKFGEGFMLIPFLAVVYILSIYCLLFVARKIANVAGNQRQNVGSASSAR